MNSQASPNSSSPQEEQKKDPEWVCSRCENTISGEKKFFCHCPECGYLVSDGGNGSANPSLSAAEMRQNLLNLAKDKIINKSTLDNYGVTYTEEECEILADVLQTTTTLEVLQLDRSTALRNVKFRNALGQNRTIKELYLHRSGCDDEDARSLAVALKSNTTIEWIDLSYNDITDSGAKELGAALLINEKSWTLEGNEEIISSAVGRTMMNLGTLRSKFELNPNAKWLYNQCANAKSNMDYPHSILSLATKTLAAIRQLYSSHNSNSDNTGDDHDDEEERMIQNIQNVLFQLIDNEGKKRDLQFVLEVSSRSLDLFEDCEGLTVDSLRDVAVAFGDGVDELRKNQLPSHRLRAKDRPTYCSPFCLPSNAMQEIMQLAGCKIPPVDCEFAASSEYNINTDLKARRFVEMAVVMKKVEDFLSNIIWHSLIVAEHFRRIEACPSDIAYALGRFAAREANRKQKLNSDVTFAQLYRACEFKGSCKNMVGQCNEYRNRLSQKCWWYEGCCPHIDDDDHEEWVEKLNPDDSDDGTWVNDDEHEDEIEHEDMSLSESLIDDDDYDDNEAHYNDMNFLDGGLSPAAKTAVEVPLFDFVYRPVDLAKSELTDQQFLIKTLRPLADTVWPGYASMYMGFDLDEERYVTDPTECDECEYPILIDAPVIIKMLKRATYAFAVASVRENIGWLHPEPEGPKVTDKEKQLQLEIESMAQRIEQLENLSSIPTVDLTGEDEVASETEALSAAANDSSKRRRIDIDTDTESVQILSTVQSSRRVSRSTAGKVEVKRENIKAGFIECPIPDCNKITFYNGGCHILHCREHDPNWVYFCAHCKKIGENGSEIIDCDCPRRNTQADRDVAQTMRNKRARDNPVTLV